jgi:hypothetical protein
MTKPSFTDRQWARIAGLCYLLVIILGGYAEIFVRQNLHVAGNLNETGNRIMDNAFVYKLGFVADLLNQVIGLPCVVIVYYLFRHVSRPLARLALIFVVIQTAVVSVTLLEQLKPLLILKGPISSSPLPFSVQATFTDIWVNAHELGYGIGLVFFGCYCLIVGWLVYHSGRVPKVLGVLYGISGLAYLVNSFTMFLMPDFHNPVFAYIVLPAFIGELAFTLWLLIKGVKELPDGSSSMA